jgi:hypothetical protein
MKTLAAIEGQSGVGIKCEGSECRDSASVGELIDFDIEDESRI